MSIWIRAICTKTIGSLAELELRDATRDADFVTWGESYDLDDDEAAAYENALRFERGKGRHREVTIMHYRPDSTDSTTGVSAGFVRVERWTGKKAKSEVAELTERIASLKARGATRVRGVLARTIETVAFELKLSDAQGMGWPIAWQTAMWLAKRAAGLVVTDDPDEWWDPETYEILLAE